MLSHLFNAISQCPEFLRVKTNIKNRIGFTLELDQLSAQSLFISALFQDIQKPIAAVCDDENIAKLIFDNCTNLLNDSVYFFPSILKDKSSVPGFISQGRLSFIESFDALSTQTMALYIASDEAVEQKTQTPEENIAGSVSFLVGARVRRDVLLKKLNIWGYEQVDHSIAPNTYSIRGCIFDVFPMYSKHPVRIEFFGDRIDSIRIFNPLTQRSEGKRPAFKLFPSTVFGDSSQTKLIEIIKSACPTILYITEGGLTFLNGEEQIIVLAEPISLGGLSKEKQKKIMDPFLKNRKPSSVFLFNPTGVSIYRSEEINEIPLALSGGFSIPSMGITCFVPPGANTRAPNKRKPFYRGSKQERITSFHALSWGDYLVHRDYGIGIYRGLESVGTKDQREENIRIEYAHGDFVFVPVIRFSRVHKYIGLGGGRPKLSRLGSGAWEKQKAITKKSSQTVVEYLSRLHHARLKPKGFCYPPGGALLRELEESFPFQETEDQLKAIKDVNDDLDKSVPMDRLIYGDVGFGKTEVAIRAAMRVVLSGRCVFFLSPTTILSDQHYITCKNRLSPIGVNVALLSRFRTKAEQSLIIEKLHNNKIDVLIGTHRLLGDDVPVSSLGLLIIDEEHRFGVKHKEAIRKLKNHVDVLTLTATPIPRTLQQSLVGIKDTSKIETPPQGRLAIKTHVKRLDWFFIKRVIQNELDRDGQVYFLHNNINDLPFYLDRVQESFPFSRVAIVHGQMPSYELEKTILCFFDKKIDVLLCTTIVESGLDVPNANTLIINNAHMFGLAQLYQIRGRVGRGNKQAFCYLCIPGGLKLQPDAFQRLKAIEHYSALGSGYNIAMKDLEIRGAGNLFGLEQSGQISRVGFELYNKILTQSIQENLSGCLAPEKEKPIVIYSGSAQISSDYMPLVQDRLYFYQKLSETKTVKQVNQIREELRDRFGPMPPETENLFQISEIQCVLYQYPISKCTINRLSVSFVLGAFPMDGGPGIFFKSLKNALDTGSYPYQIDPRGGDSFLVSFKTSSFSDSCSISLRFGELFSRILPV